MLMQIAVGVLNFKLRFESLPPTDEIILVINLMTNLVKGH